MTRVNLHEHALTGQLDNTRKSGEGYHGLPVVVGLVRACRKIIVSAAPTCTLWVKNGRFNWYEFRFHRAWRVTEREICELGLL